LKEEIARINRLVAEGKLSPEDAADLIDAFYRNENEERAESREGATNPPPTPPPGTSYSGESKPRDPFRSIIDSVEKLGKEVTENIDWKEVTEGARTSAKKGLDALKAGIEDVSKGRFNLGWLFSTTTREIRLPLSITEAHLLRVENGCGDITILPDSVESYVIARAKVRGASAEDAKAKADAYTIIVETSEHSIDIRQPHESGLEVDIEIHVAATPAVEIRSETGDVTIKDTKNSCRIRSTAGTLSVNGVSGPVEINADSGDVNIQNADSNNVIVENKAGDIHLENVKGNMNLRSASGDVTVKNSFGKTVAVEAVSGDIHLDLNEATSGTVSVRTVSGNAVVNITDGSDVRVALTTLRGISSTAVELSNRAQNDQRITGQLGEGTGSIDVSAVTGDVSLYLRDATQ
jgi:hypothetical protein